MRILLIIVAAMLLTLRAASAQGVSVSASIDPPQVGVGDQVTLEVNIEGSGQMSAPRLPDLPDFNVYSAGQSQNITIINGQMSAKQVFRYALMPRKAGTYKLGAITVEVDGKTYTAQVEPAEIQVAGISGPSAPQATGSTQPAKAAPRNPSDEPAPPEIIGQGPVFVTGTLNKRKAYVGEAVKYAFRFYHALDVLNNSRLEGPETTGFVAEDLPPERKYTTSANGYRYEVNEVGKALFPTTPGTFQVGRAALQVTLSAGLDDDPFFSRLPVQRETLQTEPVSIEVLPLPTEGRPENFSGAVGKFKLQARTDQSTATVGQPVNLEVIVSGEGNINLIAAPKLPEFPGFKTYDTVTSSDITKTDYKVGGSRKFTTVLIPTKPGGLKIEGLSFSYFDPSKGQYRTLTAEPLTVAVTGTATPVASSSGAPDEDEMRPVHAATVLRARTSLLKNDAFLAAQGIPAVALLGFAGLRLARRPGRPVRRNQARKSRDALCRLAAAGDVAGMGPVVHVYLSEKLNRPTAGLSLRELDEALAERGVPEATRARVRSLLETSDAARYAPSAPSPARDGQAEESAGGLRLGGVPTPALSPARDGEGLTPEDVARIGHESADTLGLLEEVLK
ncbi:MAG: hypothetical protein FJX76_00490 [Armatimonadetes bacterium]|nr:hypothetical protein [Armatimonadota bacterium]